MPTLQEEYNEYVVTYGTFTDISTGQVFKLGVRTQLIVRAENAGSAFVHAYDHLTRIGKRVFVLSLEGLGEADRNVILDAKVPVLGFKFTACGDVMIENIRLYEVRVPPGRVMTYY